MAKRLNATMKTENDAISVEIELPGYKKNTAELEVYGSTVVFGETIIEVRAAKSEDSEERDAFCIVLGVSPQKLSLDDVTAKMEDGLLTVILPVGKAYKKRVVEIA